MVSPYLSEGYVMGTLGYVMTFVILTILCLAMYATSKVVARIERRKAAPKPAVPAVAPAPAAPAAAPSVAVAPAPELSPEEAAAVAAAIHAFLSEVVTAAPAPPAGPPVSINPWVIRARMDTRIHSSDLIYERIRRRRGWRGLP